MNIKFSRVNIDKFQSIGSAEFSLSDRGTIFVRGINNSDEMTKSNGSGKSSLFESILWCLYGRTSSGTMCVGNRVLGNGCAVTLELNIDNADYKILRFQHNGSSSSQLIIWKNGKDISGRNKTDSEKLLREIFPLSSDIFQSMIFISQGFNSRLSSLSPSGRKERIEILTQTSERVDDFKSKLMSKKSEKEDDCVSIRMNISKLCGEKGAIESNISNLNSIISESRNESDNTDIGLLESKVRSLQDLLGKINDEIADNQNEFSKYEFKMSLIRKDTSDMKDELQRISEFLNNPVSICPTCHQEIKDDNLVLHIGEMEDKKKSLERSISENEIRLSADHPEYKKINDTLRSKQYKIFEETRKLQSEISEYHKNHRNVDNEIESLKSNKARLLDINNEIREYENKASRLNDEIYALSNAVSIVTKQFRGHLINEFISFLNSRLDDYSSMIFESRKIKFVNDDTRVDIFLEDALYDTLSGGEKRKIDIVVALAQRDLAMNISGFSSNLMVLDEVYDNLDDTAISSVNDMLQYASSEIDSLFIISHKNSVDIPYDSEMVIEKDINGISKIEE